MSLWNLPLLAFTHSPTLANLASVSDYTANYSFVHLALKSGAPDE